jgi:hypothetical protein
VDAEPPGRGHHQGAGVRVPGLRLRPASDNDGFAWLDVLVFDGINAKMEQTAITALKDAADRAWPHVRTAIERAEDRAFWDLPEDEVGHTPPPGTTGEALTDAWRECWATDGVKTALTHKLLHHKRPGLFPLIDNLTAPYLKAHKDDKVRLWGVVHGELTANVEQFDALERTLADLVDGDDDVPLTRLRLHDILLWLKASKKWPHAMKQGRGTAEWDR